MRTDRDAATLVKIVGVGTSTPQPGLVGLSLARVEEMTSKPSRRKASLLKLGLALIPSRGPMGGGFYVR
jgi:hypothetical protein